MPLFYAKLFGRCTKPIRVSEAEYYREELVPPLVEAKTKLKGFKPIQIDSPEIKIGAVLQTGFDNYTDWMIGYVQLLQYEEILVVYKSYAARTVMQGPYIDVPLPHHHPWVDVQEVIRNPKMNDLIVHGAGEAICKFPQERGEPLVCDDAPGTSVPTTDLLTGEPLALQMFKRTMVFNTYLVAMHPHHATEVVRAIDWNLYYTLNFVFGDHTESGPSSLRTGIFQLQPLSEKESVVAGRYGVKSAVGSGMHTGIEWGTDYDFRGRLTIPGEEKIANKQMPPLEILDVKSIDRTPSRPGLLPTLT